MFLTHALGDFILTAIKKKFSASKRNIYKRQSAFTKLTVGLFFLGLLTGCLLTNLFKASLYEPVLNLFQNTIHKIPERNVSFQDIFFYSLKNSIKYFFLLCFFSFTNMWRICCGSLTLYTGFRYGLLLGFCILVNHLNGIIQFSGFMLPQSLFFAPVFLLAICHLDQLHENIFSSECKEGAPHILSNAKKRQFLFSKLPLFLLCLVLLAGCALLEGWFNLPLLKYIHTKI